MVKFSKVGERERELRAAVLDLFPKNLRAEINRLQRSIGLTRGGGAPR